MARKNARAIDRKEVRSVYDGNYRNEEREQELAFERIKDLRSSFYGGLDPRRRKEMADAGMIEEDPRAMANLPRMAKHMEYPAVGFYSTPYLDDMVEE